MSRESVLALGRQRVEASMSETVTVGLFEDSTDPATGDPVSTAAETRYTGIGKIVYPSLNVSSRRGAGQVVVEVDVVLKVPVSATAIRDGDTVLVTASSSDASLVGRKFRVAAWPQAGEVTSHRYPLTEVS